MEQSRFARTTFIGIVVFATLGILFHYLEPVAEIQDDSYTIVIDRYSNDDFKEIGFKPSGNKLYVDTAFQTNEFTNHLTLNLDDYPAVKNISDYSLTELVAIQVAINAIDSCDYLNPIVIYTNNPQKIEWKRMTNCYPESAKIVDEVDKELRRILDQL